MKVLPAPVGPEISTCPPGSDPVTAGQVQHLGAVQTTGLAEVDVLWTGARAKSCRTKIALQASVLAVLGLPVDEETKPVLEAQGVILSGLLLLDEALGHSSESELVEFGSRHHGRWRPLVTLVRGRASATAVGRDPS
jgi:hypothetical protein